MYCAPTEEATQHRSFLPTPSHPRISVARACVCPIASLLSAPHQHHTQERSFIEEGALPRALYDGRFEFLFSKYSNVMILRGETRSGEGRSEGRAKERKIFGKRRLPPQLFKMCSTCHWKCGNKWGPVHSERMCRLSIFRMVLRCFWNGSKTTLPCITRNTSWSDQTQKSFLVMPGSVAFNTFPATGRNDVEVLRRQVPFS